MAKRRSKGEGTLFKRTRRRKDGTTYVIWAAEVTIGYKEDGKQARKTVYGKSQKEALAKVSDLKGQISAGTFSDTRMKVGVYLQEWLKYRKLEVKPRTHRFYADYIRLYLEPRLGRTELSKLTAIHVQSMMQEVASAVSPDAANKARGLLTTALKQAVRLGLIPRNPVEAVDKLKHEPKEMTLWTPEQALHFLEVCKGHRLFAAFYLALSSGMRHGEILGLRWQDIEEDVIHVRQSLVTIGGATCEVSTPKTKRGIRQIVVDPDTLAVLRQHRDRQDAERARLGEAWERTGLVFTNELGSALLPRNFDRAWYELLERSRLPRIRFHDLRHFHVSLLIRHGFDPRTVADRVGHSDPSFTLRQYSHMFESQRRAAAVPLMAMLSPTAKRAEEP